MNIYNIPAIEEPFLVNVLSRAAIAPLPLISKKCAQFITKNLPFLPLMNPLTLNISSFVLFTAFTHLKIKDLSARTLSSQALYYGPIGTFTSNLTPKPLKINNAARELVLLGMISYCASRILKTNAHIYFVLYTLFMRVCHFIYQNNYQAIKNKVDLLHQPLRSVSCFNNLPNWITEALKFMQCYTLSQLILFLIQTPNRILIQYTNQQALPFIQLAETIAYVSQILFESLIVPMNQPYLAQY